MAIHVRYQEPFGKPVNEDVLVHKNNKGFHIKIGGKFYFPEGTSVDIISNLSKFDNYEFWVAITSDNVSYGKFALAVPDFFVRENSEEVYIEKEVPINDLAKEVPINDLAKEEHIFSWDYLKIGSLSTVEESDTFIEIMEDKKVPETVIKEAITVFYDKLNHKNLIKN